MRVALGGPSEEDVVSFKVSPATPVRAVDDARWQSCLAEAEQAVLKLLTAKRELLQENPQAENVLWHRYNARVMRLRRNMEAISY